MPGFAEPPAGNDGFDGSGTGAGRFDGTGRDGACEGGSASDGSGAAGEGAGAGICAGSGDDGCALDPEPAEEGPDHVAPVRGVWSDASICCGAVLLPPWDSAWDTAPFAPDPLAFDEEDV